MVISVEAALLIVVVTTMVSVWVWFRRRAKPITVGDVVSAVERGVHPS